MQMHRSVSYMSEFTAVCVCVCVYVCACVRACFHIILCVYCFGGSVLNMCVEYCI